MTIWGARARCGGRLLRLESFQEANWVAARMAERGIQRVWVDGVKYSQWDWRERGSNRPVQYTCHGCPTNVCPCQPESCASRWNSSGACPWRLDQPSSDPVHDCLTLTQALAESAEIQALGNAKLGDEPCDGSNGGMISVVCEECPDLQGTVEASEAVQCAVGYGGSYNQKLLGPAARPSGVALALIAAVVAAAVLFFVG